MTKLRAADFDSFCRALLPAVLEAGRVEMAYLRAGFEIEKKADQSPVTIADREAEAILVAALGATAQDIPVIAEEAAADGRLPPPADRFFLVDALDGTRLFIKGKPEFTINVAFIDSGKPQFGLIYAPALSALYVTRANGGAAFAEIAPVPDNAAIEAIKWTPIHCREPDFANLIAFNSRTAGGPSGELLKALGVADTRPMGSSLKFCQLAAGTGDLYARLGDTNEWDTAAGQAILEAAGGTVTTLDGAPLTYGHALRDYKNPHFVAWGGPPMFDRISSAIAGPPSAKA